MQGDHSFPYDGNSERFYELFLPNDDRPHGYMFPENVHRMPWTKDFEVDQRAKTVKLKDASDGSDPSKACNVAFAKVVDAAIRDDVFATIHCSHSEPFRIVGAKYPVWIERFACPLFGIVSRGAHLTVYTMSQGKMHIWVPRRSPKIFVSPNKLDTTVAGGVRADECPFETIIHEADEEASLPADLIRKDVRSTGCLTYINCSGGGDRDNLIFPDCVCVYDLEVGTDIKPAPKDDEVKEFYLMSVDEVKAALANDEFKDNSAVVMIDFFIRHGILTPENERDYVEIITRMHRRMPFPTTPA